MNRKFIRNSNYILRKILNSEANLDIVKDIIESFLKIQIKNIKINSSPIMNGEKAKEYGIVDVRLKTVKNEELNVGIQIIDGNYIQNKMFLYYAKIHSNQVFYNDNRKIAKTVTINILDTSYFSSAIYHRVIKIKTNIIDDNILETMELHVLELSKFHKMLNESLSKKDLWTMYLKGLNEKQIEIAKKRNLNINKLDSLIENYWDNEQI